MNQDGLGHRRCSTCYLAGANVATKKNDPWAREYVDLCLRQHELFRKLRGKKSGVSAARVPHSPTAEHDRLGHAGAHNQSKINTPESVHDRG